jgi:alpha-tubulin suppressor-like RCC1 family protein
MRSYTAWSCALAIFGCAAASACGGSGQGNGPGGDGGPAEDSSGGPDGSMPGDAMGADSGADTSASDSSRSDSSLGDSGVKTDTGTSDTGATDTGTTPDGSEGGIPVVANTLSAGGPFACGVSAAGVLQCWGGGTGTPAVVAAGSTWQSIAVGDGASAGAYLIACAIRSDATLQCFTDTTWTPTQQDTGSFQAVAVGQGNQCAIATSGALYCWGQSNYDGQLGTGDTLPHTSLTRVGSANDWHAITVSSDHACGLTSSGALFCWGNDYAGELGDGPGDGGQNHVLAPIPIAAASSWLDVDASAQATCGVRSDGVLLCWGRAGYPPYSSYSMPTQIDSATDWAKVRQSADHACALKTGGALYCWGSNNEGQLGDGTLTSAGSPQRVGTATDWVAVAVGASFSCAAKASGAVYCWGSDDQGQLGQGTTGTHTTPTQIGAAGAWANVAAGPETACAVGSNGGLSCWGSSGTSPGTLFGTDPEYQVPYAIGTGTTWATVSVTAGHACARQQSGAISCWGQGSDGELGLGSGVSQATLPTSVGLPGAWVGVEPQESFAIDFTGHLFGWGYNFWNQLGPGTGNYSSPTALATTATWLGVTGAVGSDPGDTCGIQSDGSLWCWGFWFNSSSRECFNGSTCTAQDAAWTVVSASQNGTFYGLNGGTMYTWSSQAPSSTGKVGIDTNWKTLTAGGSHECGIRTNGTLGCIGSNSKGQLGDGTTTDHTNAAVQVGTYTDWTSVAAGTDFTCGVRGTGTLYCWGSNASGAIGDGSAWSTTPLQVQ